MGYGSVSELVAKRRGADKAKVRIEGDQAAVEGLVVECIQRDAVTGIEAMLFGGAPWNDV